MTGFDDDLTAALRRELAGIAVPYDDARADAAISAATAHDLLGYRSWQAPLAAAAVVVTVGGGAAIVAATRDGGSSPAGGGPALCATASTSAPSASTPPQTSSVPVSATPSSTAASSDPYVPPLPAGTSEPVSVGSATDTGAPCGPDTATPPAATTSPVDPVSSTPSLDAGGVRVGGPSLTFDITAAPGTTRTEQAAIAGSTDTAQFHAVLLRRLSGDGGTMRVSDGTHTLYTQDVARIDDSPEGQPQVYFLQPASTPTRLQLSCAGTTTCHVRVTLSAAVSTARSAVKATSTPTR